MWNEDGLFDDKCENYVWFIIVITEWKQAVVLMMRLICACVAELGASKYVLYNLQFGYMACEDIILCNFCDVDALCIDVLMAESLYRISSMDSVALARLFVAVAQETLELCIGYRQAPATGTHTLA